MKLPKLTINKKLLFSYLGMALLTVVASAYAVISLQNLTRLAHIITNQDQAILDNCKQMMDALIAQESTEKKALIFKDPSFENIFRDRGEEFKKGIVNIKKYRLPAFDTPLARLSALQEQYSALFQKELALLQENRPEEIAFLSEREGKLIIDAMATHVRTIARRAEQDINSNIHLFKDESQRASRITITLSLVSLISGFSLAMLITYNIARPLKKLEKATALIAEGKFTNDLNMNRGDAIGSLARAFIVMAERLKILEAYNLDASPLTGLPGNLAIEKHIEQRLTVQRPFSLCHLDLDNFKPFADHYGYAWGSEVIKEVGQIIEEEVKANAGQDIFIGHVGGDDFVLISEPEAAEKICQSILREFGQRSLKFYSEEDRSKGFFTGNDRSGFRRDFPLITMTIAIATDDGSRFRSPLDMAEMAAKLKEYAKSLPGSNYVKQEDVEHLLRDFGQ